MNARMGVSALLMWFASFGMLAAAEGFSVPHTPDHYVTDTTGALRSSTKDSLEAQLGAYEKATRHQVVVYIANTTGDVPLETWTAQTADTWKIGRKRQHDGVVLFVFLQDHKARIEVGYGLESALPDAQAKRIITHDIVPRMRARDVDGAVSGAAGDILHTITPTFGGASAPPDRTDTSSEDAPAWFIVLFIIVIIALPIGFIALIVLLVSKTKRERFGKAFHDVWFWGGTGAGSGFSGSSSWGGGFGGGGGFSAGGGSFGGGGASGSW